MVGITRRMHKLKALLNIRHGPGAALLPSEITRIHMEFASRWNDGQYGPRRFWRDCLPRLKYWNPAVPMIVNRTSEPTGPATMTIYFRQQQQEQQQQQQQQQEQAQASKAGGGGAVPRLGSFVTSENQPSSSFVGKSPAPEPTPSERVVSFDMKGLHSDAILADFLAKTGAVPVAPTPQEEAEFRELEERAGRSQADRETMRKYIEAQRRQKALLKQAMSEAAAIKQSS
ncbi:50S ribosomal protein mrp49 [Niveomyces insectorum RCEF 264]|uniref:50S ribosomal protein mrp49 n=1 Tax=Niveomyces insectorum RCEF 264 TaxID=1081102 RepID=A0A167NUM3_9HYPO|nr:50S ribosomal protein mrp49 [Niveomyces insectorum RCEF 264]